MPRPPAERSSVACVLREEIEHRRRACRADARCRVSRTVDRRALRVARALDDDPSAFGRELRGIRDEVADDLLDAHRIRADRQAARARGAPRSHAPRADHRRQARLGRRCDRRIEIERAHLEMDLAELQPRYVEQIVDEPRHVRHLTIDQVAGLDEARSSIIEALHDVDGVAHRRERIAQLVREHREKLVALAQRARRAARGARAPRTADAARAGPRAPPTRGSPDSAAARALRHFPTAGKGFRRARRAPPPGSRSARAAGRTMAAAPRAREELVDFARA